MTDRELLELAAKDVGFTDARWNCEKKCIETSMLSGFYCYWNPLKDDGDALRLAVKINLFASAYFSPSVSMEVSKNGLDWLSATRRAIVRAAAEIGRTMP